MFDPSGRLNLLRRLMLAIVLSSAGECFLERFTDAKMCLLQLSAFMTQEPARKAQVPLCLISELNEAHSRWERVYWPISETRCATSLLTLG